MSGAASTLHNININFAAAARGQMRCHPSRGSGDLRQRRHSSRICVRPLPRVALWCQPAESGRVRPLEGSQIGSSFPTIPHASTIVNAPPVIPALIDSISWKET
jgi:hypothetical protein